MSNQCFSNTSSNTLGSGCVPVCNSKIHCFVIFTVELLQNINIHLDPLCKQVYSCQQSSLIVVILVDKLRTNCKPSHEKRARLESAAISSHEHFCRVVDSCLNLRILGSWNLGCVWELKVFSRFLRYFICRYGRRRRMMMCLW